MLLNAFVERFVFLTLPEPLEWEEILEGVFFFI